MIIHTVRLWCFGETKSLQKLCTFVKNDSSVTNLLNIEFDDGIKTEVIDEKSNPLKIRFGSFQNTDFRASKVFSNLFKNFKDILFLGSAWIFAIEHGKVGASYFIGKDGKLLGYGDDFLSCEEEDEEEITTEMENKTADYYSEWFTDWFFDDIADKLCKKTWQDEIFCDNLIEFSQLYSQNKDNPYYNNFIATASSYVNYFPKSFAKKHGLDNKKKKV